MPQVDESTKSPLVWRMIVAGVALVVAGWFLADTYRSLSNPATSPQEQAARAGAVDRGAPARVVDGGVASKVKNDISHVMKGNILGSGASGTPGPSGSIRGAGVPQKAGRLAANTTYSVCFTPGGECEEMIVDEISRTTSSLLVQAYSFTSPLIAKALVNARDRGVDVRVILDKSQRTEKYSGATFLANNRIPVAIDETPAIAHNKVMVFDQQTVLTGSYNFSKSAQTRNAENILFLRGDAGVVKLYTDYWMSRWEASLAYR